MVNLRAKSVRGGGGTNKIHNITICGLQKVCLGSHLTLGLIDSFAGGVKLSSVFGLVLGFAFLLDHCVVRSFVLRLAHVLVPGCYLSFRTYY